MLVDVDEAPVPHSAARRRGAARSRELCSHHKRAGRAGAGGGREEEGAGAGGGGGAPRGALRVQEQSPIHDGPEVRVAARHVAAVRREMRADDAHCRVVVLHPDARGALVSLRARAHTHTPPPRLTAVSTGRASRPNNNLRAPRTIIPIIPTAVVVPATYFTCGTCFCFTSTTSRIPTRCSLAICAARRAMGRHASAATAAAAAHHREHLARLAGAPLIQRLQDDALPVRLALRACRRRTHHVRGAQVDHLLEPARAGPPRRACISENEHRTPTDARHARGAAAAAGGGARTHPTM